MAAQASTPDWIRQLYTLAQTQVAQQGQTPLPSTAWGGPDQQGSPVEMIMRLAGLAMQGGSGAKKQAASSAGVGKASQRPLIPSTLDLYRPKAPTNIFGSSGGF